MLIRYALAMLLVAGLGGCEMFSSVKDLTEIFSLEKRVMDALNHYVHKTEDKLDSIKRYLSEYEEVRAEMETLKATNVATGENEISWTEKMAGNPIHAFHLIRRLTRSWKSLQNHDPQTDWKSVEDTLLIGEIFGLSQLSDEEELQEAAQSLIMLQNYYMLNTSRIAGGNVWGIQSSAELTAQDCLYLGKNSFNQGMYFTAIDWFEQSYILAGQEMNETVSQSQVMRFQDAAIEAADSQMKGNTSKGETSDQEAFRKEDLLSYSMIRTEQYEMAKENFMLGRNLTDIDHYENFQTLCRGEQLISEEYRATLHCYYDSRSISYLMLMPAKVEEIYHDPTVLMFHDVIRENEIDQIEEFAKPQLQRAMVQGPGGKGKAVSRLRTSQVAWLDAHEEVRTLGSLNKRITLLSGLSSYPLDLSAEQLQVSTYGIGGHYNMHRDYLLVDKTDEQLQEMDPLELIRGDRIATWMFYLADVTRGGATAFPMLGVSVFPQKGSAVFWHNLKKSGKGDARTLHGGCPVVHGSKWVANKWFREKEQFLRRPCGLSEDE